MPGDEARQGDNTGQEAWPDTHRQAAVGALGALVGGLVGGPVGAVVGGVVPPYALALLDGFGDRWRGRRRESAGRVLMAAADEMNVDPEAVLVAAETHPQKELMTGQALAAGANTAYEAKIEALGRVLARALETEDDAVLDETAVVIGILAEIEAPHVRVLQHLLAPSHFRFTEPVSWQKLAPHLYAHEWDSLQWTFPEYGVSLHGVVSTLERLGLVNDEGLDLAKAMKDFGGAFQDMALRRASVKRVKATPLGFSVFERVNAIAERLGEDVGGEAPGA